MEILVVFNSFNVVKNLKKPDPLRAKCPHFTLLLTILGVISLSKFSSLDFILTLTKGVFSFHIARPLIEILYLVLVSFNVNFEKFKVDDLVECR